MRGSYIRILLVLIFLIPLVLYLNTGQNNRERECKIRLEYINESKQKVNLYINGNSNAAKDSYLLWVKTLNSQLEGYAERC